jgi:sulfur carrier protein
MRILVNGAWRELRAEQLAGVLGELGYAERTVSTAVNGQFVPTVAREGTALKDGDQLEVLAPMQGG